MATVHMRRLADQALESSWLSCGAKAAIMARRQGLGRSRRSVSGKPVAGSVLEKHVQMQSGFEGEADG